MNIERPEQRDSILRCDVRAIGVPHDKMKYIAVVLHYAFGRSCRTGGVEDVGKRIGSDP